MLAIVLCGCFDCLFFVVCFVILTLGVVYTGWFDFSLCYLQLLLVVLILRVGFGMLAAYCGIVCSWFGVLFCCWVVVCFLLFGCLH